MPPKGKLSPRDLAHWNAMKLLIIPLLLVLANSALLAQEYNPLRLHDSVPLEPRDLTVKDESRSRDIPIRVFLPQRQEPVPVVLFSHGLGGSREMNGFMGKHWGGRGYAVVFLQHPGSDDSIWRNQPLLQRMTSMRAAASGQNLLLRLGDVKRVLDQLEIWNREDGHFLEGKLDLKKVGMSGHSFGAQTTQGVSGQAAPLIGQRFTDERIRAAIAFSPGVPQGPVSAEKSFARVQIPWLLMTGTEDVSPIGGQTVESRLAVFPALPPGDKYELVLHGAEHSAFTERSLPGESRKRNPNHHKVILALSTAFWDAYLKDDLEAKTWLQGEGPGQLMDPQDRWQKK